MKKFLVSIFLLISILCYSQTFQIETSQGIKTLTIPEGSSVEETLIEISKLYWEERYDLEALQKDHAELIEEIDRYKQSVNVYEKKVADLLVLQEDTIKLYEKKDRRSNFGFIPIIGVGCNNVNLSGKFGIALYLFQRTLIQIEISLPYEISFRVGYKIFF